jgi:hypothetical protein
MQGDFNDGRFGQGMKYREKRLKNASFIQPWTISLVEVFDMFAIPRAQKTEQRVRLDALGMLDSLDGFLDLAEQLLMCLPMFRKAREPMTLEELLFANEVQARELDKPPEMIVDVLAFAAAH